MDRIRQSEHYDVFLGMLTVCAALFCAVCFIVGLAVMLTWIAEAV